MKKAKTPKAPDYAALATQQAATAKQNWQENLAAARPNQVGPEGTNTWAKDANGNWLNTVAMTPERQQLYDTTNQKAQEQMAGFDTSQVDLSGAPAMPTVGGYNEQAMNTVRALQQRGLTDRRAATEAQMAAKGLMDTGSAYDSTQRNLAEGENDADLKAILAGINQGNVEFGQGMQAHTTGTGDILNQNTANLQKVGGMMGQSNSFRMPTFGPAPTPGMGANATPDMTGAANASYKAALDKYNAQAGSGLAGKLLPIAGSVAGSFFGPIGTAVGGALGKGIGGMMSSPKIPTGGGYDFGGSGGAQPDASGFNW